MVRVDNGKRHQRQANSAGQIDLAVHYICTAIAKEHRNGQALPSGDTYVAEPDAVYSAAMQQCGDSRNLCDSQWAASTARNALNYFLRQVLPHLDQIGLEADETDLAEIKQALVAKALRSGRSNRDPAQAEQSVQKYLYQANILYRNLHALHPELPPLEFQVSPRSTTLPEQAKAIPDATRVRLAVLLSGLCAVSGLALGAAMMLLCGLRTAEAAAVVLGDLVQRDGYVVYPVLYQLQNGKRIPTLKTEAAYRVVVGPVFLQALIQKRIAFLQEYGLTDAEIAQMPLTASPDSPNTFSPTTALARYGKQLLLAAGYSADAILAAEALQVVEPDLDNIGQPGRDVTAYILRRDWCTRACNICGLTSAEVDYLMGHVFDRKLLSKDYTSREVQAALAAKLERYVFLSAHSCNPAVRPAELSEGTTFDLPEYTACTLQNTSSVPLRITLEVNSREPGEGIDMITSSRPVKLSARRSLPDSPEQQARVPIGDTRRQDYYDALTRSASQIDMTAFCEGGNLYGTEKGEI